MENQNLEVSQYRSSIKNWWVSLILGIIFFIVGIMVFMKPGDSYLALSVTFGLMVIVSGILEIYIGAATPAKSGRGWLITAGVIETLLGIIIMSLPAVMLTILPFVLGFWLMFRGFTTIGAASDMMSAGIKGAGWTLTFAILVVISSFFVLANPIIGVGVVVIWLGISLLFAGITLIISGFHLLNLNKHLK